MSNYFFIKDFVDKQFAKSKEINSDIVVKEFMELLAKKFDNEGFVELLTYAGFIPDLYPNDSSEETLYTKLVEVLVAEWARRLGLDAEIIKQKSSKEDICIIINKRRIVCDAKSFRLGRSQKAPNAKDFLKLEDIRKWMSNYKNSSGGLVVYPCTHEWSDSSDVYLYCSTKDAPTVMLPYKYLAYILHYVGNFNPSDLLKLWDYSTLFPNKLSKNMAGGNKAAYWKTMNKAVLQVTDTTPQEMTSFMKLADKNISACVDANLTLLTKTEKEIVAKITQEIEKETDIEKLKKFAISYQTLNETEEINKLRERIQKFRVE